jgi:hypothetical protein
MFFLAADLSNAKLVPVKDCKEWVLGVALSQYLMRADIKKIPEKGESGMMQELTQMHDMNVFRCIKRDSLTKEEQCKGACIANVFKG